MSNSFYVDDVSPLLAQGVDCIYCHTDIVLNDHVIVCDRCRSPHHVDCWQANANDCATFGCNAPQPQYSRRVPASRAGTARSSVRPANLPSTPPEQESRSYRPTFSNNALSASRSNPELDLVRGVYGVIAMIFSIIFTIAQMGGFSPQRVNNADFSAVLTRVAVTPTSVGGAVSPVRQPIRPAWITGLLNARGKNVGMSLMANTPIGLRRVDFCATDKDDLGTVVFSLSDSYDDITTVDGRFSFFNVNSGRYFLLLEPDDGPLLLRELDGSGNLVVVVDAGKKKDIGIIEYNASAYSTVLNSAAYSVTRFSDGESQNRPLVTPVLSSNAALATTTLSSTIETDIDGSGSVASTSDFCDILAESISIEPAEQTILVGESASIDVTISNQSDVVFEDIKVLHQPDHRCDVLIQSLNVGKRYTYRHEFSKVSADTKFDIELMTGDGQCSISKSALIMTE